MSDNIGVNTKEFNAKVLNLLSNAAPQLTEEIMGTKRRFMHNEIEEAIGPEAAGVLASLIRSEGVWDEESRGTTMEISLGDSGRALSVYDDAEDEYPVTKGLCIMVSPS